MQAGMTEERAQKIAATLVKQFSRERYFAISLPKFEDLDLIAKILRENFGCTVVWSYLRNKINVYCPEISEKAVAVTESIPTRFLG
jgi:hypothetical protein